MTRHEELKRRAAVFARDIAHFTKPLLRSSETEDPAKQLRRSATAVAANYRAAGLARTDVEFAAKIGVVRNGKAKSSRETSAQGAGEKTLGRPC